MQDIVKGQRWVSHTEQDLGLGIIREISGRLITIDFPAAEEQRTYARDNAPISRIGDETLIGLNGAKAGQAVFNQTTQLIQSQKVLHLAACPTK